MHIRPKNGWEIPQAIKTGAENVKLQGLTPRSRHTEPATAALRERRSRPFV